MSAIWDKYPYDPFDDWGIEPGPGCKERSFQGAIRAAVRRLGSGEEQWREWLAFHIQTLKEDDILRTEVQAVLNPPTTVQRKE
jgi:hypothetical protein